MSLKLIGMLLLAGTLFAGAPAAFSQVSIGIQIGAPPPPRVIAVRPPCPDQEDNEFAWIDGYWYPAETSCPPPIPCNETNHQLNTLFCDCLRAGSRPALPATPSSKSKCAVSYDRSLLGIKISVTLLREMRE